MTTILDYTSKTMTDVLVPLIIKYRGKNKRIRSIYLNLRKRKDYRGLSDIAILNWVVGVFDKLGLLYSRDEIYSAFRGISLEDYDHDKHLKHELLKSLQKKAKLKSPLSENSNE